MASLLSDVARVVRWDQRGCGRSGGAGPHTVERSVEDLETIRCAHGRAWAIESLAAALPNVRVQVLPGVGHVPWVEAPTVTADLVRGFLSELS
jgi:pimeloyl-ACP methyl ester carboxylesterase